MSPTSIFAPVSTPADSIFELSMFVLAVTAGIFVVVFGLLVYAVVRFRRRRARAASSWPKPSCFCMRLFSAVCSRS